MGLISRGIALVALVLCLGQHPVAADLTLTKTTDPFLSGGTMMQDAISEQSEFKIKALLQNPYVDPNGYTTKTGARVTFLDFAAKKNVSAGVLKLLLDAGAKEFQYVTCNLGLSSPVWEATRNDNFDLIDLLTSAGLGDFSGTTAKPTQTGCSPAADLYQLSTIINTYTSGTTGAQCRGINITRVQDMLSRGFDINASIDNGMRLLSQYSLLMGNSGGCFDPDGARYLLSVGADPNIRNDFGFLPIDFVNFHQWGNRCRNDKPLGENHDAVRSILIAAGSQSASKRCTVDPSNGICSVVCS